MGPLTSMTIPYERKFRRDTLRKRAREVEILYNKVKWSKTSNNDSHTRCDRHVCEEFEYSFKYSWLEAKLNKKPIILEEDDKEGNPLKKDAISNKDVKNNKESLNNVLVDHNVYLKLLPRHE